MSVIEGAHCAHGHDAGLDTHVTGWEEPLGTQHVGPPSQIPQSEQRGPHFFPTQGVRLQQRSAPAGTIGQVSAPPELLPDPLLDPELLPDPLLDPELLPDPLLDPELLPEPLPDPVSPPDVEPESVIVASPPPSPLPSNVRSGVVAHATSGNTSASIAA
jgi:hypothetical protein